VIFLSESQSVHVSLFFVYICIAVGDPIIKKFGILLTNLTMPGFPLAYVMIFFVFNDKIKKHAQIGFHLKRSHTICHYHQNEK
jgi:hypothetical protein